MGWNTVRWAKKNNHTCIERVVGIDFYHVHSYICEPKGEKVILGTCEYGSNFVTAIAKKYCRYQFHPRKVNQQDNNSLRILQLVHMLKKRIIPVLLLSEGRLVKGKNFSNYRETGMPISAIRIYSSQDSDEIALINISRTSKGVDELKHALRMAAEFCFMPLLAGGNIHEYDDACELFKIGADKILINTAINTNPDLVKKLIRKFGSQSIVAGIDYKVINGEEIVYFESGKVRTNKKIEEYAQYVEKLGVGEIFMDDIDNDGTMKGMNKNAIEKVASIVKIPVIASGGVGTPYDILDILEILMPSCRLCKHILLWRSQSNKNKNILREFWCQRKENKMILKGFTIEELEDYLNHLIKTYFLIPKNIHTSPKTSKKAIAESLDRLEHCFKFINLKYYKENGQTVFNPLHSDHLASYLWFLADSHYHCEETDIMPGYFKINDICMALICIIR